MSEDTSQEPWRVELLYSMDARWSPRTGWQIREWRPNPNEPLPVMIFQRWDPPTFEEQWAEEWIRLRTPHD